MLRRKICFHFWFINNLVYGIYLYRITKEGVVVRGIIREDNEEIVLVPFSLLNTLGATFYRDNDKRVVIKEK